jgi:hypothetical protein
MTEFRNPTVDELEDLLRVAHRTRSAYLKSLCMLLWTRLTGHASAPATTTYA